MYIWVGSKAVVAWRAKLDAPFVPLERVDGPEEPPLLRDAVRHGPDHHLVVQAVYIRGVLNDVIHPKEAFHKVVCFDLKDIHRPGRGEQRVVRRPVHMHHVQLVAGARQRHRPILRVLFVIGMWCCNYRGERPTRPQPTHKRPVRGTCPPTHRLNRGTQPPNHPPKTKRTSTLPPCPAPPQTTAPRAAPRAPTARCCGRPRPRPGTCPCATTARS